MCRIFKKGMKKIEIHKLKNICYTEVVISQLSSTKLSVFFFLLALSEFQ
jgi:hypothetical protein